MNAEEFVKTWKKKLKRIKMTRDEIINFQKVILKNQEIPKDLEILLNNECAINMLNHIVDFEFLNEETLEMELSHYSLSDDDKKDLNTMANIDAINKVFKHITFFAMGLNGSLIGYWHGKENEEILKSPLVKYNTEGEFYLLYDSNIIESLVADCTNEDEDDYEELRILLKTCNIELKDVWDLDAPELNTDPEEMSMKLETDNREINKK